MTFKGVKVSLNVCVQLADQLTPLDVFLGLVAAAAHDVDHPGVNQPFLIKTSHHLASLYQVLTDIPTVDMCGLNS